MKCVYPLEEAVKFHILDNTQDLNSLYQFSNFCLVMCLPNSIPVSLRINIQNKENTPGGWLVFTKLEWTNNVIEWFFILSL